MSDEIIGHGKVVFITYSVLDEAGQVMGQQDMPTGYVHGANSGLFASVERALEGKREGDQVEAHVPHEEAFGPHDPDLVIVDALENVPPMFHRLGAEAEFQNEAGEVMTFRVVEIADGQIKLDGNNPLAGKPCIVAATVVSVRTATSEEMRTGFPAEQGQPSLH